MHAICNCKMTGGEVCSLMVRELYRVSTKDQLKVISNIEFRMMNNEVFNFGVRYSKFIIRYCFARCFK